MLVYFFKVKIDPPSKSLFFCPLFIICLLLFTIFILFFTFLLNWLIFFPLFIILFIPFSRLFLFFLLFFLYFYVFVILFFFILIVITYLDFQNAELIPILWSAFFHSIRAFIKESSFFLNLTSFCVRTLKFAELQTRRHYQKEAHFCITT